ncbi:hypothetical protein [Polymorphospora sp. NPDC050346]|uniref:hypothetical protein n=1 Tax=Polymorphospora sp. NPDC050346 TaxID=3155780 RepID=UPI0033DB2FE7
MSGQPHDDRPAGSAPAAGERVPTAAQQRLIDRGTELFGRIAPGAELGYRLLADDEGVVVFQPVRGGGSIYVAADGSVLFAASAIPPHRALEAFRAGRRTPVERFTGTDRH